MIVGFKFDSIETIKDNEPKGNINIESTPVITGVEERKMKEMKNIIGLTFEFKVLYKPDYGYIRMVGEVLFRAKNSKNVLKAWEESKSLESDVAIPVLNFVLKKCLTHAVYLSELIGFPPPVQFPVIKEKSKEKYIG